MKLKVVVVDLEISPSVKKWALRIGVPVGLLVGGGAIAWAAGPHVWNTGDTLQAADLNDSFSMLQSQITTTGDGGLAPRVPSAFHASLTKATSVNTGYVPNVIAFDQVDYDLGAEYNKVTGAFVAKAAGVYTIDCTVFFIPNGTAGTFAVNLLNNNVLISGNELQSGTSAEDSGGTTPHTSVIVRLAAGDTVTCNAYQGTGGPQALDVNAAWRNTFSTARLY